MYIVTFYSFKGGVGRSMALANIATELVKRGRRVLVVDFDLEAPGLHTFDFGGCSNTKGGVVDYVEEYLSTNKSPDVMKHVVRCDLESDNNGELWLMPPGTLDDTYSSRLSRLDWHDLYENKSGYLFFEDLKAQWQDAIDPDYILIDSRTGHTDVGGICTRQLPDSVVFLFFPNDQNLSGLRKVVSSLDEENKLRTIASDSPIEKHFVTSNVPDLDDEDDILANRLVAFSRELNYKSLTATIHRYNSLALLNQEIFTLKRPNTRLAQEYRELTGEITRKNFDDIDGAVSYLTSMLSKDVSVGKGETAILNKILSRHKNNPEVLTLMSKVSERQGDYGETIVLITRAIEHGDNNPLTLLRRAKLMMSTGNSDSALLDILSALNNGQLGYLGVRLAINLIERGYPSKIGCFINTKSFLNLKEYELIQIVNSFLFIDVERLGLGEEALNVFIDSHSYTRHAKETLGLLLIARGEFVGSMHQLSNKRPDESFSMDLTFNYAMAEWGKTKQIPVDLFSFVLEKLSQQDFSSMGANVKQCIALCYWAVGNSEMAIDIAKDAIQEANDSSILQFSCWSYLYGPQKEFVGDIRVMIEMFKGGDIKPKFFFQEQLSL
jgi:MinD-like ATPase involved in chromosome partitioning or flagellar assembly